MSAISTLTNSSTTTAKIRLFENNWNITKNLDREKRDFMPELPKAIFIGPAKLGNAIVGKYSQNSSTPLFNFVAQVNDIPSLWRGLEDQTIDNEVQVMLTTDLFFDPTGESDAFEQLVAIMAPYCFFGIFAYKPQYQAQIQDSISAHAGLLGASESPLHYFIDKQSPTKTLTSGISHYIKNTTNTSVADVLAGRAPREEVNEEAQETIESEQSNSSGYAALEQDQGTKYLGRVLAITSSKGGSGKSTVATTLSAYLSHASENSVREGLAERPLKIILLDLDVRDGQIGFLTGHIRPSVIRMRMNGINEQTLADTVIHSKRLKVDLLLAPRRPRLSDDTPPEFYLELIRFLKLHYDYVVLDTSVNYLDPLLEKVAYPIADQIVFVTDVVVNSVFSMTRWIQEVTKAKEENGMGIPRGKIGVVVNKSMTNINMDYSKIEQGAAGLSIISVIPNNAKLMAHSANMQSMELALRHNDIRQAFKRLAKAIVGRSYPLSDNVTP